MTQTKQVTLDPGDSQIVTFIVVPMATRTFAVAINGLTGSFEAIDVAPTGIALSNLRLDAINVPAGMLITATVTATNYGAAYEYKVITFHILYDGRVGKSWKQGVGLNPGESADVDFEFRPYSIGDYEAFFDGTPSQAPPDLLVDFTVY